MSSDITDSDTDSDIVISESDMSDNDKDDVNLSDDSGNDKDEEEVNESIPKRSKDTDDSDSDMKMDHDGMEEDSDDSSFNVSSSSESSESGSDDSKIFEIVHKEEKRKPIPFPMEFDRDSLSEDSDIVTFFEHWLIDFKHIEVVSPLHYSNTFRNMYLCQQRRNDCVLWTSNRYFKDFNHTKQFVRIARYCMQFIHPALVEMRGFAYHDMQGRPVPVIMYDHVDGFSLNELLDSQGAQESKKSKKSKKGKKQQANGGEMADVDINLVRKMILVTGIASAVAYLHDKGIAHGRLDISNIMVNRSDLCPKIFAYGFDEYFQREKEECSFANDIHDFGVIAGQILDYGRQEGSKELKALIKKCVDKEAVAMSDVLAELEKSVADMPKVSKKAAERRKKLIKDAPDQCGPLVGTNEEYERYLNYLKTADCFQMKEFMSLRRVPLDYSEMIVDVYSFRKLLKADAKVWDDCKKKKKEREDKDAKLDKENNRSYLAGLIWPKTVDLDNRGGRRWRRRRRRRWCWRDTHADKVDDVIKKLYKGLQKAKYGLPRNLKASAHILRDLCNHGYDKFSDLRDVYRELGATEKMWQHFNLMASKNDERGEYQGLVSKRAAEASPEEERLVGIARMDMESARQDPEDNNDSDDSDDTNADAKKRKDLNENGPTQKQILAVRRNLAFQYTGGKSSYNLKLTLKGEAKGLEFVETLEKIIECQVNNIKDEEGAKKKTTWRSSCYSNNREDDVKTLVRIARMLYEGKLVPQDLEKAQRYCSLAKQYWNFYKVTLLSGKDSDDSDDDNLKKVNKRIRKIEKIEQSIQDTNKWISDHEWKCKTEGLDAMLEGFSFLHGINGCPELPSCAYACYSKSSEVAMCSYVLGCLHKHAIFPRDIEKIESAWKYAAENGDRKAQFLMNSLRHPYILDTSDAKNIIRYINKYYGTFGEHPRSPDYTLVPLQANVLDSAWPECLRMNVSLDTYRSSRSTRTSKDRHGKNRSIYHFKGTYDGSTFGYTRGMYSLDDPETDVERFVSGSTGRQMALYASAVGLEWLHDHNMISRNFELSHIEYSRSTKGKFFVSEFWPSRKSQSFEYGDSEFRAPELFHVDDPVELEGHVKKSDWFDEKVDVYSFGIAICQLLNIDNAIVHTEDAQKSKMFLKLFKNRRRRGRRYDRGESRYKPDWKSVNVNSVAKGLIERCLDPNPEKRPSFEEITNILRQFYLFDDIDTVAYEKFCQEMDREAQYGSGQMVLCEKMQTIDTIPDLLYIADSYFYGENGFPFNYTEACRYYERLANRKNAYGEFMFAYLAANGLGMSVHLPTAHRYYQRAIEHARRMTYSSSCKDRHKDIYQRATMEYALLLKKVAKQPHRDPNPFRFDSMIKELATTSKAYPDAWYQYGLILESDFNFYVGEVMSLAWYQKGADMGHFESLYRYCIVLLHADYLGDFVEYGKYLALLEKTDEIGYLVEFCKTFNTKRPKDERKRELSQRVRDRVSGQVKGDELRDLLARMMDLIEKNDTTALEPIIMETHMHLTGENGKTDMEMYIKMCAKLAELNEWRYLSLILEATTINATGDRFQVQTKLILLAQFLAAKEKQHGIVTLFNYAVSVVEGKRRMRFADSIKYFAWLAATNEKRYITKAVTVIERMLEREWHRSINEISKSMVKAVKEHPEFQAALDKFVELDGFSSSALNKDPTGREIPVFEGIKPKTQEKLCNCYWWFHIAFGYVKAACDMKSKKTYIKMGEYFEYGRGTPLNIRQALVWYTKASKEGKKNSRPPLLKLIDNHWDEVKHLIVCKDWDEKLVKLDWEVSKWASKDTKKAAEKGKKHAKDFVEKHEGDMDMMRKRFVMQAIINDAYRAGSREGIEIMKFMMKIDTKTAAIYAHNQAVENHCRETQFYTAKALLGGHKALKDIDYIGVSTGLLKKALKLTDTEAECCQCKRGKTQKFKKDKDKGLHYLYRSCQQGYIPACYHYGMLLITGKSEDLHTEVKIDAEQGMMYLRMAANGSDAEFPKGYPLAKYQYGKRLFEGDYVEKNIREAFTYLKAAADQGNKGAMYLLSNQIFCSDEYNLQSSEECRKYLEEAARGDGKLVDACYEYALQLIQTESRSKVAKALDLLYEIKHKSDKAAKELKSVLKQLGTTEKQWKEKKEQVLKRKSVSLIRVSSVTMESPKGKKGAK